jgi:aquaporin Z
MYTINWRAYIAEMIGVFTLCFASILAISNNVGVVGVALVSGLAIAVMIAAFGGVSGGYFNPAVTLTMLMLKKISVFNALGCIVFQILGGYLGAKAAVMALGGASFIKFGSPPLVLENSTSALMVEAIFTFILMAVIIGAAVDKKDVGGVAGLFIGLAVAMNVMAGYALTGAAMNPARFLGPVFASGEGLTHAGTYVLGPLFGAIAAGFLYVVVFKSREREPEKA